MTIVNTFQMVHRSAQKAAFLEVKRKQRLKTFHLSNFKARRVNMKNSSKIISLNHYEKVNRIKTMRIKSLQMAT